MNVVVYVTRTAWFYNSFTLLFLCHKQRLVDISLLYYMYALLQGIGDSIGIYVATMNSCYYTLLLYYIIQTCNITTKYTALSCQFLSLKNRL